VAMKNQQKKDVRRHLDLISKQWDDALERLRQFVE
jgi:hypothetical protein